MNDATHADTLDLDILNAVQQDIPCVPRPWAAIASRLGIPESELLERLGQLCRAGIVRGISPIIESGPLGLTAATLVALPIPEERIREVADFISRYPEVSHNFRRNHRYSLWFTLSAKDEEALRKILDEMLLQTGFAEDDILNLPTIRKIKIDVRFPLATNHRGGSDGPA